MKRHSASLCIISLLILCLTGINSIYAQKQAIDTITIYHKYYTSTFSKSKRLPVVVKYWLTRSMLDCERRYKRFSRFKPDPSIPEFTSLDKDYKNSGYDRGHQMDAFDCGCDSTAMAESFYYSNVAPQLPSLNRGIWKKLEEYTRKSWQRNTIVFLYGVVQ
jgi:endonuclease G, mitochondrial